MSVCRFHEPKATHSYWSPVRRGPNSENATGNTKGSERKQEGAIYEHVLYAMCELCRLALYVFN